jgi:hypothetical protein
MTVFFLVNTVSANFIGWLFSKSPMAFSNNRRVSAVGRSINADNGCEDWVAKQLLKANNVIKTTGFTECILTML